MNDQDKDTVNWSDKVKWYDIPERMREGIVRYVEKGGAPGHFLLAVFSNDLMEAMRRADDENAKLIASYTRFLTNQCPAACWGSTGNVHDWVTRGGIAGNDRNEPLPFKEWSRWAV